MLSRVFDLGKEANMYTVTIVEGKCTIIIRHLSFEDARMYVISEERRGHTTTVERE